jgi:chromosome segregation ATPase
MDFTTLTILAVLSFILAWFGIMIFTTETRDDDDKKREPRQVQQEPSGHETEQVQKVAHVAETPAVQEASEDEVVMYQNMVEKYRGMVQQLRQKVERLEQTSSTAGMSNDQLIDWIADLRRENKYLKNKLTELENEPVPDVPEVSSGTIATLKQENEHLRERLEKYRARVTQLEDEIEELKSDLHYYRDMVNKLQATFTVINKYNYRACIRDPETGEFRYELVKFPPDFDPFNPTYISEDGTEIYEQYGIKIPTKLGDLVRKEFKKRAAEPWEEAEVDWKVGR